MAKKKALKAKPATDADIQGMIAKQPVSNIRWVPADTLTANSYNPNKVFAPELKLLKVSLLSEGWTQPIVIRENNEIIDGYHRWLLAQNDKDMLEQYHGFVPVAMLENIDIATQMMATIRHNRGRGSHAVLKMADIIATLVEQEIPPEDIQRGLGMEKEEVQRLHDRGNMLKRGSRPEFNKGKVAV